MSLPPDTIAAHAEKIKNAATRDSRIYLSLGYILYTDATTITPEFAYDNVTEDANELTRQTLSQSIRQKETTPPKFKEYPFGTRAVNEYGEVLELQNVPINRLVIKNEGTQTANVIEKYAKWYRTKGTILPIKGVENFVAENGKIVITDGNHRAMAMQLLGIDRIPAWVALTDRVNPARPVYAWDDAAQRYATALQDRKDFDAFCLRWTKMTHCPVAQKELLSLWNKNKTTAPSDLDFTREDIYHNQSIRILDILPCNDDGQTIDNAILNVADGMTSHSDEPILVMPVGIHYMIGDGFHRVAAAIKANKTTIMADCIQYRPSHTILEHATAKSFINSVLENTEDNSNRMRIALTDLWAHAHNEINARIVFCKGVDDDSDVPNRDLYTVARALALQSGIIPLSNKELACVIMDCADNVLAALFSDVSDEYYSFDIVVDEFCRGKGLGNMLMSVAFEEFGMYRDAYPDIKYSIDVINPVMVHMLKEYGFVESMQIQGHTIMTHPTNDPSRLPKEAMRSIPTLYGDGMDFIKEIELVLNTHDKSIHKVPNNNVKKTNLNIPNIDIEFLK